MRILLHICCAPCALMPVEVLRKEGHEVMGLFYNPNIQPYTEHQRRLQTLQQWAQDEDLKLVVMDEYDPQEWLRQMVFREEVRCGICHHQRLARAAHVAKKGGFDAFSTTLLYSVRQKHQLLAETAQAVADSKGTKFLYRDFRPFWKEGVALSQELGLYRQQYCGCIYSERDRYLGPPRKKSKTNSPGERQTP
jgi:predicted adenine nucleotide alpha hydrolase (AANH) superfamily ATPase